MRIFLLIIILLFNCETRIIGNTYCTEKNISILESDDIKAKIIGECNLGTKVEILSIQENRDEGYSDDQKKCFKKVKIDNLKGWINCNHLAFHYFKNEEKKTLFTIAPLIYSSYNVSNYFKLNLINLETNSMISIEEDASSFYFSKNFKYVAVDKGSTPFRRIKIYDTSTLKLLFSSGYYMDIVTLEKEDGFIFKKIVYEGRIPKGYLTKVAEVIFKNNKITYTGQKEEFKEIFEN
jgi:hypothetical protein